MYESLLTSPGGLFSEFERLRRELEQSFGSFGMPTSIRAVARGTYPAVNVGTTPQSIEIYAFAPGLDRSKLDVNVERGVLTVSGERGTEMPEGDEQANVYANERFTGRFKRVVSLPEDADPQRVDAQYRDGLLHISVKRREASQPQRIQIQ